MVYLTYSADPVLVPFPRVPQFSPPRGGAPEEVPQFSRKIPVGHFAFPGRMARPLLYVPPGGALFELTSRTLHGRFLLRPHRRLKDMLVGVLGRAQRRYGVALFGSAFLSNHFHLLGRFERPHQLAGFMQYFKANLAKEVGRLYGWREKFWGDGSSGLRQP